MGKFDSRFIKFALVCAVTAVACDTGGEPPPDTTEEAVGAKADDGFDTPPVAISWRGDVPGLFDVMDVAADDVLNVRAEPDASSPIVSRFEADATNIEVVAADHTGEWGLVNVGEIANGWVSMRFLQAHDDVWVPDGVPQHLSCVGTEPFWGLAVQGDTLQFRTPDGEEELDVSNFLQPFGFTAAIPQRTVIAGDGTQRVTASISPGLCSDGASDKVYGLTASVVTEEDGDAFMLSGCCSISPD